MQAVGLALVLTARAASSAAADAPDGLTDHHVHVLSPTLVRDWKSLGVPFTRPDDVYTSAAGLLGPGAEGRLEQALLVPMAHFYGNEEFRGGLGLSLEQEQARVRAENDYVAAEAARYPGRATALCSFDFSRPYAWEELRRCRSKLRSPGLKLHLRSAGADIGDAEQLGRLEAMAGWAGSEGMGLLLHFDTGRGGLEAGDVERFFDRVLAPHPRLEVLIAHLGGSGGYGLRTRTAFRAFLGRVARNGGRGPLVRFDLSGALLERESEGVPATTAEEAAALVADLRQTGFDAVVFGSDYPVFDPRAYARLLGERLELSAAELRRLLANRVTFLEAKRADAAAP